MFPNNKTSACSIENRHYEDDIPDCPNDKGQTASKSSDQQVQTNDVTLLTEQEEDILFLIRSYKIRIDEISTLAYGIMYNYSKKQYNVNAEQIYLSSEDDDDDDVIEIVPVPEPSEGLLAGLEFSALNKQIMNLVNSPSERQNVTLLLLKILKVLIQDRNIVYGNQIMNMIEEQCQEIEVNSNDNETRSNIRQEFVSTGVNTDLTGDIDRHGTLSISPKRKQTRTRTETATANRKSKEKTMAQVQPKQTHNQQTQGLFRQFVPEPPAQQHHEPQPYDQLPYMQQMHYQENLVPSFPTPQNQEAIVNLTPSGMNQPQCLNQMQQHYSQRFLPNASYGPHSRQSSMAGMRPHTMSIMNPPAMSTHPTAMSAHPTGISPHPTAMSAHPTAISAHPTAMSGHSNAMSGHATAMSTHSTAMSAHATAMSALPTAMSGHSTAMSAHPTAMSAHPTAMSAHPTGISPHPTAISAHPTAMSGHSNAMSVHPTAMSAHPTAMSAHPPSMSAHPPSMSAHPPRPEIPALRPPSEHYVEEFPLSLVSRMTKAQNVNQLPPSPVIPPKPNRPGTMPAPVIPAPILRRRDSIDSRPGPSNAHQLRYDPLIQASTSAENALSAHNVVNQPHQVTNPLIGNNQFNASPMRMQQNLNHPRLPSAMAWEAQIHHTLPQNTPYNQNARMYDTYGRYQ